MSSRVCKQDQLEAPGVSFVSRNARPAAPIEEPPNDRTSDRPAERSRRGCLRGPSGAAKLLAPYDQMDSEERIQSNPTRSD